MESRLRWRHHKQERRPRVGVGQIFAPEAPKILFQYSTASAQNSRNIWQKFYRTHRISSRNERGHIPKLWGHDNLRTHEQTQLVSCRDRDPHPCFPRATYHPPVIDRHTHPHTPGHSLEPPHPNTSCSLAGSTQKPNGRTCVRSGAGGAEARVQAQPTMRLL